MPGRGDYRSISDHQQEQQPEEEAGRTWYGTTRHDWPSSSRPLRLADFEDSVHPPHILAPRAYMLAKEVDRTRDLHTYRSYRSRRQQPAQPKWKVQEADFNAWQRPNLDNQPGSIYTMKEDVLRNPSNVSLSLSSGRSFDGSQKNFMNMSNPQQDVEKRYIQGASNDMTTSKGVDNIRFTLHIMRKYNKPATEDKDASYGAPAGGVESKLRHEKSTVSKIVDGVVHPPSSIKLVHSNVRPMHFQSPSASAFCEVLGPTSCHECIEGTNRFTAHRVENLVFPDLPLQSGTALVIPKLGHIVARENRRLSLKAQDRDLPETDPESRYKSRERSVTLAIRKTSNKVQNSKKKTATSDKAVLLPVLSQGVPTLSTNKRGKLRLKLYDRCWEARANNFFPEEDDDKKIMREDSSLHLSEQQRRLRQMLDNIKYKSAVRGENNPQEYKS